MIHVFACLLVHMVQNRFSVVMLFALMSRVSPEALTDGALQDAPVIFGGSLTKMVSFLGTVQSSFLYFATMNERYL